MPRSAPSWRRSAPSTWCAPPSSPARRPRSSGAPWWLSTGPPWPSPRRTVASGCRSSRPPSSSRSSAAPSRPGPLLPTVTQFAPLVREVGSTEQRQRFLSQVASGAVTGTVALADHPSGWAVGDITMTAERAEGGWVLHGTKLGLLAADGDGRDRGRRPRRHWHRRLRRAGGRGGPQHRALARCQSASLYRHARPGAGPRRPGARRAREPGLHARGHPCPSGGNRRARARDGRHL